MSRATSEEWNRYYDAASKRRRECGGDPLVRVIKRQIMRQKMFLAGSSLFVAALVMACYEVLVR